VIEVTDFRKGQKRANVSLERRKQGPFIGDGCRIGANAVIEAGTILMPGCVVDHGEVIRSGIYTKDDLEIYRNRPQPSATN
jgi:tetrahydrodipicolinate N-succinyltransferase